MSLHQASAAVRELLDRPLRPRSMVVPAMLSQFSVIIAMFHSLWTMWFLAFLISPAAAMSEGDPIDTIPGPSTETFYKSVVLVKTKKVGETPEDSPYGCIGVLIAQNFVLTDGHCVANAQTIEVHLYSGSNIAHPVIRKAVDWVKHPKWDGSAAVNRGDPYSYNDQGVILIASAPQWNTPADVALEYDPVVDHPHRPLYIVAQEVSDYGQVLSPLKAVTLHSFTHYGAADSRLYGGWLVQPTNGRTFGICHGDSGAPVFAISDDGHVYVVGLHNTGGGIKFVRPVKNITVECATFSAFINVTFDTQAFISRAEAWLLERHKSLVRPGAAKEMSH